jgi:hypothetical protein
MTTTQITSPGRLSTRLDTTAAVIAPRLTGLPTVTLYGSLALVFLWFGAMKFTAHEAEGILPIRRRVRWCRFCPRFWARRARRTPSVWWS